MPARHIYPNANVWLEYGMMLAFGKAVIPLLKRGYGERPFDVRHLSIPEYDGASLAALLAGELDKFRI